MGSGQKKGDQKRKRGLLTRRFLLVSLTTTALEADLV
jgi:hypothetical protein